MRVFLVEDVHHMQGVLGELLAGLGDITIVASRATEAEARLWLDEHVGEWDVAVLDLILEQGTGMGVIAKAKACSRGGQVVVFSEYATPGIRKHCLALGAHAVFQKSQEMRAFLGYFSDLADLRAARA